MKQKLLEEKAKLGHDMRALHQLTVDEKRGITSDEQEKWAKMTARINEIDAEIARIDQLDTLDTAIRSTAVNALPGVNQAAAVQPTEDEQYRAAFQRLLRSTEPGMSGIAQADRELIQKRAQTVGTGSSGGFTVPTGFGDRLIEAMKQFGGVANVATTIVTETGNALPFPTNDDTGNLGAIIAENIQDTEQDLTFGQVSLNAYTYTSKAVRVPYELLQDSAVDMEGYLARKLGERIGRITASHFATGDGTGKPQGLTVGAGSGATAAGAAAIAFNDLVELEHSVDPAYRMSGARFVFNDTTLKLLQKTVDAESRPLWLPGVGGAVPASIYGYPYTIDQGMPNVATGLVSVVFGLTSEYYVRAVRGIEVQRLVERWADFRQVGFFAFSRMDGRVMNSAALKKLTHP